MMSLTLFFVSLLHEISRFHLALRLFGNRDVKRTSVTHPTVASCSTFCSNRILTSSVIYYWTDTRQPGISLLITNSLVLKCVVCYVISHTISTGTINVYKINRRTLKIQINSVRHWAQYIWNTNAKSQIIITLLHTRAKLKKTPVFLRRHFTTTIRIR